MIEIKQNDNRANLCSCCMGTNDLKIITFHSESTNSSSKVRLCKSCRYELSGKLRGCEKRIDDLESLVKDERYKRFTLLEYPTPFDILFKDTNIELVQLHSLEKFEDEDDIVGFVGQFSWKEQKLVTLDADVYSADMLIYGYNWFKDKDSGADCLDILVYEW